MASMSTAALLLCLTWTLSSAQGIQSAARELVQRDVHKGEQRRAFQERAGENDVPAGHVRKRDLGNPSVSGYLLDLVGQSQSHGSPVASHNLLPRSSLLGFLNTRSRAKADSSSSLQKSELGKEGHDHIGEPLASGSAEEGVKGGRGKLIRRSLSHKQPSDVSSVKKLDSGSKDSLELRLLVNGSLVWDYGDPTHNLDRDDALSDAANRDKRALQRLRSYIEVLRVHMQPGEVRMAGDSGGLQYRLQAEPPLRKTMHGGPMEMSRELTSADLSTLYGLLTALEGNLSSLPQGSNGGSDRTSSQGGKNKMVIAYDSSDRGSGSYQSVQFKGAGNADRPPRKLATYNVPAYRKELREAKRLLEEFLVELNKRKSQVVS